MKQGKLGLGKKKKKKFGVDTRRDISIKNKSSEDQDKAKLDKMGEKLTSYTDNRVWATSQKARKIRSRNKEIKLLLTALVRRRLKTFSRIVRSRPALLSPGNQS